MAAAVARAKYVRIAPRKVRLVADLIRGKKVSEARTILQFTVKRAGPILSKILESAVANAESVAADTHDRIDTDEMVVKTILVDGGPTLRRFSPQPRGRATRIRKRSSHVTLRIAEKTDKQAD
ncbi:MAG: 50S ribosomal protein L22 [Nitrospiraceae bacterium]|nr:50S ribosomal protein L22 [Nitrospiraceae bacterium]